MHKRKFTARYFERNWRMFELTDRAGEKPKVKPPVNLSQGELKMLEDQFFHTETRKRGVRIIARNLTQGPRQIHEWDIEDGLRLLFSRQYERGYREGELAAKRQRLADEIRGASVPPPAAPMRMVARKAA